MRTLTAAIAGTIFIVMLAGQSLASGNLVSILFTTVVIAGTALALRHRYTPAPPVDEEPVHPVVLDLPLDHPPRTFSEYMYDLYGRKK